MSSLINLQKSSNGDYQGLLIKISGEYVHSSGIVEFLWFFFSFVLMILALARGFYMKGPVHALPEDHKLGSVPGAGLNNAEAGAIGGSLKSSVPTSQAADAQQRAQKYVDGNNPKLEEQVADPENHQNQIAIDDNESDPANDPYGNEAPLPQKKQSMDNADQHSVDSAQNRVQEGIASLSVPVLNDYDEALYEKPNPFLLKFCKLADNFVDYYFIPWTIMLYLIAQWGCYIYTAFMCCMCIILVVVFNHLTLFDRLADPKPFWSSISHLFYHFWLLTLFIAYLINNQRLDKLYEAGS